MRHRLRGVLTSIVVFLGLGSGSVLAQSITQQQADEILKELRAIRQLLEGRVQPGAAAAAGPPPEQRVALPPVSGQFLGRADAPVTMVEFTDAECPFCRQFHATAFQEIKKNYIDTGRVRFATRDFPLGFHANAKSAAIAMRCGGEQGKFWELRDALSATASGLESRVVLGHAAGLGLDMKSFQACLASGKFEAELQKDLDVAAALGVQGTPTFVIGKTKGAEKGWLIVGALPYDAFAQKIEQALNSPANPN